MFIIIRKLAIFFYPRKLVLFIALYVTLTTLFFKLTYRIQKNEDDGYRPIISEM